MPTITPVGQVHLATYTPGSATGHQVTIRAKKASGVGTVTINAALYEGTTNRSGDLASGAITTSLADYTLSIPDANAANIVDRSNLSIKFWGASSTGDTIVVSVAEIDLIVPAGSSSQVALAGSSLTGTQGLAVLLVELDTLQGVSGTGARSLGTLTAGGLAVVTPSAAAKAAAVALVKAASLIAPSAGSMAAALTALTVPGVTPLTPSAGSASAASIVLSRAEPLTPSARSNSQALLTVRYPDAPTPYVFDAIVILDAGSNEVAQIARSFGPLEAGRIDGQGVWVPASDPVVVIVDGFGIDPSGNAYFDTAGPDFGDHADLVIDPVEQLLWLQS